MRKLESEAKLELKAVVLAGGKEAAEGDRPRWSCASWATARSWTMSWRTRARPSPTTISMWWSAIGRPQVRAQLGSEYHQIVQPQPLGTGHAVLQLLPTLKDYQGNLLILYGDTPLFRPASIRGLLNRHSLKQSHLTLLTAIVDQAPALRPHHSRCRGAHRGYHRGDRGVGSRAPNPRAERGRVHRFRAADLLRAAEALVRPRDGKYQLTDCVHQLIRSGLRVESYQICDPDEIQGINTSKDLEQAEFILQKRLFRPRREEEQNQVSFGTGGWRAIIGEGFTLHNVRRLSQALANEITRRGEEKRGVLIGYDRRFLSKQAGRSGCRGLCGQQYPGDTPERGRADAAHHLRHGDSESRLRPGVYRQPQSARMEWPQGLPRRRIAAAGRRDGRRFRPRPTGSRSKKSSRLIWISRWRAALVERSDFTNEYVDAVEA